METNTSSKKIHPAFVGLLWLATFVLAFSASFYASNRWPTYVPADHPAPARLDYRSDGLWYAGDQPISSPGFCPAEDSCYPLRHGLNYQVVRTAGTDIECDSFEHAGLVECVSGSTGKVVASGR